MINDLLKPGYVRFDGTKFVTDDTIQLTGPTGPPGPQGIPGTNGIDGTSGTSGINAFATLVNDFTVPDVGSTVSITVNNSGWMVVGQDIFIGTAGYFQITGISSTIVTVKNLGLFQISPGTNITAPQTVSPAGAPGSGSTQPTLTNLIFVDVYTGNDTTGTGSINYPFKSISKALQSIPASPVAVSVLNSYQIMITPGTYNENLTFTSVNTYVALVGFGGPWSLGTPGDIAYSITWTFFDQGTFTVHSNAKSGLAIGTVFTPGTERVDLNNNFVAGATITGTISILDGNTTTGCTKDVYLNCKILDQQNAGICFAANTGYGSQPVGKCNVYAFKSYFASSFHGPPTNGGPGIYLQMADKCQFNFTVFIGTYGLVQNCLFNVGMNVSANDTDVVPCGLINCYFTGAFTGPADAKMDGTTYYWFTQNGASAVGANIILQEPTLSKGPFRISLVSGIQKVAGVTYITIGGGSFDVSDFPATYNTLNRSIYFAIDYSAAINTDTVSIQLWDATHGVVVTGTADSTSDVSPAKKFISSALTVGSSNGNIRNDVVAQYQVQMAVTAGSVTNNALCYDAYLLVKYS